MPLVQVKVIEGVFSAGQKTEVVTKMTDTIAAIAEEKLRPAIWVVVEEIKGAIGESAARR